MHKLSRGGVERSVLSAITSNLTRTSEVFLFHKTSISKSGAPRKGLLECLLTTNHYFLPIRCCKKQIQIAPIRQLEI